MEGAMGVGKFSYVDSYSVHFIIFNNKLLTFAALLVKEKEFCFPDRGFQKTLTESDERNSTGKAHDQLEPLVLWTSTCLV
jgi:hypothetical protein